MANILSTANSALAAAQAGLATTAHNIANAQTVGYNRQVVLQAAIGGQDEGGGFIGKGTEVVSVRRVYNDYLAGQARTVQTSLSQYEAHYTQASRINNMLADPNSGLSPVLQDFFKSVQNLAANPDARGTVLSAGESLAGRFQSMDGQLQDLHSSVNGEITNTITSINSYAQQIADLNKAIADAKSGSGQMPNDLMDQRDHLVDEMSKLTKVTVSKEGTSYGIFIGSGQPMVVGNTVSQLKPVTSLTDLSEVTVGLATNTGTIRLTESSLPGGKLGGLFSFRSTTLTNAQNELGRIALGLASTFNDQHKLGKDATGAMGGNFFGMAPPQVDANTSNAGNGVLGAAVSNVSALKASDYKVVYDGSKYNVTRLTDNALVGAAVSIPAPPASVTIDGVDLSFTPGATALAAGDNFIVKPTVNAAGAFRVLVADPNNIAAAAPILTSSPMTNTGSGVISAGSVDKNFLQPTMVAMPVKMYYDAATGKLNDTVTPTTPPSPGTGFPFDIKVTDVNGNESFFAAGTPVTYTPGATITFGVTLPAPPPPSTLPSDVGGVSFKLTGAPANGDQFTIDTNTATKGDNRNMVLLGQLQTTNTLMSGTVTYQGALASLVSSVGNKTHELEVGKDAQTTLTSQLQQAQQAESGVNMDEEGANLLRYQQAYVAAGKVMQAVKEMFDTLVQLGVH